MDKVSVILPTYNESKNIIALAEQVIQQLQQVGCDFEVLVIDDHSPDGTLTLVNQHQLPNTRAVYNQYPKGLGTSIGYGVSIASGDVIMFMDSDFNHHPKYIPILLSNLQHYDCVIGSRFMYGGGAYSKTRLLLSWIFNIFVRVSTRHYITDNLYGFAAIKTALLKPLDQKTIFYGFGDYFIRLLFVLQKSKANILQIPMFHSNRRHGEGNDKFVKTLLRYTKATLKLATKRSVT